MILCFPFNLYTLVFRVLHLVFHLWLFDPVRYTVKIEVKHILPSALNSGSCLFSGLCKCVCKASGKLSVLDREVK